MKIIPASRPYLGNLEKIIAMMLSIPTGYHPQDTMLRNLKTNFLNLMVQNFLHLYLMAL